TKKMICTVKDSDKQELVPIAKRFQALGYTIYATRSTADVLIANGVDAIKIKKLAAGSPNALDLILEGEVDLVIDTPTQGAEHSHDGFIIRRNAIETGVNVLTAIDTAKALITSLENREEQLTLIDIATI
ncbi:MAG: carbamoyl-phosphate synthase large subunit, partial [Lachnospiraceae bacterium]|nr:carbamoyl-phosphate synthase large subunit [Lachnospiraceae bacterium]